MLFEVEVTETEIRKGTTTVEAETRAEAEELALREAGLGGVKLLDAGWERKATGRPVGGS